MFQTKRWHTIYNYLLRILSGADPNIRSRGVKGYHPLFLWRTHYPRGPHFLAVFIEHLVLDDLCPVGKVSQEKEEPFVILCLLSNPQQAKDVKLLSWCWRRMPQRGTQNLYPISGLALIFHTGRPLFKIVP